MASLEDLGNQQGNQNPSGTIEVTIRGAGIEQKIIGSPDAVTKEVLSYLSTVYPSLELVSRVFLTVDNVEFLNSCHGNLGITPEGPAITRDVSSLKDRELIMLHLAGSRLMRAVGRKDNDSITLDELTRAVGRPTGSVAGRLSELSKEQLVERVEKGSYRLTTMGARIVVHNLMPKLSQMPGR